MADEEKTTTDAAAPTDAASTNGAAQPQQMPQMQVLGQFIRDLSFENIAVQKGQAMEGQPDINVQVGLEAKKRTTEGQYEVAVKLNVGKGEGRDRPDLRAGAGLCRCLPDRQCARQPDASLSDDRMPADAVPFSAPDRV